MTPADLMHYACSDLICGGSLRTWKSTLNATVDDWGMCAREPYLSVYTDAKADVTIFRNPAYGEKKHA